MSEPNPYSPPHAAIHAPRPPLGTLGKFILVLIALQLLLSVVYSRVAWALMSIGEINVLTFLAVVLSAAFLALGGALLVPAPRVAFATFVLAAFLGALAFLAWRQPLAPLMGAVLSVCAGLVSTHRARSFAKV